MGGYSSVVSLETLISTSQDIDFVFINGYKRSIVGMSIQWHLIEFNSACDVLETLLNEIKLDDSFCKDGKSSSFEFQKYAELQTLCLYIQSGNDKEQMNDKEQRERLFSELKHEVIKFLHYQKLKCFWLHDWNTAFHKNRELRSSSRFIRLENEFSEKFSENSKYVIAETKCYINWDLCRTNTQS